MPEIETFGRPGPAPSHRPLHFFWLVDCSSSMRGIKIGSLNTAIKEAIPEMRSAADENPTAQMLVRALKFSTGASWITTEAVPVENYAWEDLEAGGLTDMGAAFKLLAAQLEMPPMPERALPPVIVLISDGMPNDDYKTPLAELKKLPWGKKAVKVAIAIGKNADLDLDVLEEFTGDPELVLTANDSAMLTRFIKWISTAVVSSVIKPLSDPNGGSNGEPSPLPPMPEPGPDWESSKDDLNVF